MKELPVYRYRRKKCLGCDRRWTIWEISEEDAIEVEKSLRRLREIEAVLKKIIKLEDAE